MVNYRYINYKRMDMKSRLFVVDEETLTETMNSGVASIFVPKLKGKYWLKTIADLMADMLQIEIGDYIFLWETKSRNNKNRIHGVYRAISKPFYKCNSRQDRAPFKIHIQKAYDFAEPIDEYDVLNNPNIKNDLWTILGKKVAGKSRGTTPLSPKESKYLITLLEGINPNSTFIPFNNASVVNVRNPLCIQYPTIGHNPKTRVLTRLNPNRLHFFSSNHNVLYEKVLETIFNQELTNKNVGFFSPFGIDVNKVVWYSNYLPYSVEQSEMDYVIFESEDGINYTKIFLIEFMKEKLDKSHIQRALLYSKWINESLCLGSNIVEPIIVCKESYDYVNGESSRARNNTLRKQREMIDAMQRQYKTKNLQIFVYNFYQNPIFIKKK